MNVIEATYTNTGCPWPGGVVCYRELKDVVAVGKVSIHGDFVTRYVIKTTDGGIYFVKLATLEKSEAKAIAKTGKLVTAHWATREVKYRIDWTPYNEIQNKEK